MGNLLKLIAYFLAVSYQLVAQASDCSIKNGCPAFDNAIGRNHYGIIMRCSYGYLGETRQSINIFSCSINDTKKLCELTTVVPNTTARDELIKYKNSIFVPKKDAFEGDSAVVPVVKVPIPQEIFQDDLGAQMTEENFKKIMLIVKPGIPKLDNFNCEKLF